MKFILAEPIFVSCQGEWLLTGKPSIFIRFFGCNLDCNFCDSLYSVHYEKSDTIILELEEVIEKVKSFKCNHIIFTWGEPTLFQKQIKAIQQELWAEFDYELETNWGIKLDDDFFIHQINISPKLENSWNELYELKI